MAKMTPKQPTTVSKCKTDTTINVGKQQSILNNEATGKTYTDRNGEGKSASQPVRERNLHQIPIYGWKHTRFLSVENVNDSGNGSLSWLRETKIGKHPLRETQDVLPCVRMRDNGEKW